MKMIIATNLLTLLLSSLTFSQDRSFLCPGVKVGYAFGEKGGWFHGYELSYVINSFDNNKKNIYGFVISIDFLKESKKVHIGIENTINDNNLPKSLIGLGLEVGPTLLWNSNGVFFGFTAIMYHGFLLHPFYGFSFFNQELSIHEIGAYLKVPFMMKGKPIRIGG